MLTISKEVSKSKMKLTIWERSDAFSDISVIGGAIDMYSPQQNGQPAGGENMVQKISKKVCAWKLEMDEIHREGWVSWTFIKSFFYLRGHRQSWQPH